MSIINRIHSAYANASCYRGRTPDFVLLDRNSFIELIHESNLHLGVPIEGNRAETVKIFGMDIIVPVYDSSENLLKVCYYAT